MATVYINKAGIKAEKGALLKDVLASFKMLETPCGGHGRCGKCRVKAKGELSDFAPEELCLLTEQERKDGVRLACLTRVMGECEVFLQEKAQTHVLVDDGKELLAEQPMFSKFGAAVDIGTTTLAACLYAPDGRLLARAGSANPQAEWGADVISRIGSALDGKAQQLADAVRRAVNELLTQMTRQAQITPADVDGMVITGNTAMLYLFTKTNPECLSHAPFEADRLFGECLSGNELGLCCEKSKVYLPRCMASFVGADTTTALIASGITEKTGLRMMVDIGTNGEIVLWSKGTLLCCSTAAGPAFEGAGLSMGMPGRDGAVDHVVLENGELHAHVLGEGIAAGICGSGVVDALACLLKIDGMDETGLLEEEPAVICGQVSLTQKDVRAIQLAKSAVAAGISTLAKTFGKGFDEVEELAVAGGFGSYLNVENAGAIGLLPGELVSRVDVLGNAALKGAAMMLLDKEKIEKSELLAKTAKPVELSTNPYFMQAYMECMMFEEF